MKEKRREAPEWIYPWKSSGEPWLPKILALAFVLVAFAVLLTSVHIRMPNASQASLRRATLIQVTNTAEGRALTLRAKEGGPFPSRFEPASWPAFQALEKSLVRSASMEMAVYQPSLLGLSEKKSRLPSLSEPGKAVLPKPGKDSSQQRSITPTRLVPRITPLAGIHDTVIPDRLPEYPGDVLPALAAAPTTFLVCLDPSGSVIDCIALDPKEEQGPPPLEQWLRGVSFKPGPAKASRWVGLSVSFANQTITDGSEPR